MTLLNTIHIFRFSEFSALHSKSMQLPEILASGSPLNLNHACQGETTIGNISFKQNWALVCESLMNFMKFAQLMQKNTEINSEKHQERESAPSNWRSLEMQRIKRIPH